MLAIVCLGTLAITDSVYTLYNHWIGWNWFVLAILTLISGSATVKLPSVPATISVSEVFVFTSVLLFGPAAGVLTVALDALVISLGLARRGHPFYRIAFNVGAVPAALWIGAHIFYAIAKIAPLSTTPDVAVATLVKPLAIFAISYFLLNSSLIVLAIHFEKGLSILRIWRDNFAWLSLNYFGGASVAALLVTITKEINFTYFVFVLPLLAVLYITFKMSMGRVEDANLHLSELNKLYMSTIETLAMAIDAKDQITHGHIRRVQHYATALAREIGVTDASQIRAIEAASLLHDMGKLAVPEYILNKPGPLTPSEFAKMKLHASVGADILSAIDFPYPVVPIVRHHHENWDGRGYPDGLRGSEIPIGARILSVVDCFDALTSDRPYRPRLSDAEAVAILLERRGSMYDPLVVDTFVAVHTKISPDPNTGVSAQTAKTALSAIVRGASQPEDISTGSGLDDIASSTEEMLVLYDLAKSLTGQLDLSDAADVISKHIRRILPAATCVFYVYDEEPDELYAAYAAGENSSHFSGLRIPRGQRLTGWVAANKQTILNSDPVLDLGEVARAMRPRLRSCLNTPLVSDNELVGVLTVYSTHRDAFTEDHRRIIEVVARQVSETVRHAIDFEYTRSNAFRDQLTGLPNRQHLARFVASEAAAQANPAEFSVIFVDMDSLKSINRRHGRAAGDQVLGDVADAIRKVLRGADILFRYESDEFVVLLTQTDAAAARRVSERIAERVLELQQKGTRPETQAISVTLGVASAPADGTSVEDLVAAAKSRERTSHVPNSTSPSVH